MLAADGAETAKIPDLLDYPDYWQTAEQVLVEYFPAAVVQVESFPVARFQAQALPVE